LALMDVAIALEPTDNELQLGCGGSIQARVAFTGQSAHSSRPWQGENAIYKSLEFLHRLKQSEPAPREVEGLAWMTSMSATQIYGGRAPNVIPDEVVLNVNARYAPDQTSDEVAQTLKELAGAAASVTLVDISPPAPPYRNHPLLRSLQACGVNAVRPKFAWTDVARFAQLHVPAANFGPGCLAQAHQRNEWTSAAALHDGDLLLRRWLAQIGAP
jgi:succinyl-diaminopimelate desuccinylase